MTAPSERQSLLGSSAKSAKDRAFDAKIVRHRSGRNQNQAPVTTIALVYGCETYALMEVTLNPDNTVRSTSTRFVRNATKSAPSVTTARTSQTRRIINANAAGKKSAAAKARKNGHGRKAVASSHARSRK